MRLRQAIKQFLCLLAFTLIVLYSHRLLLAPALRDKVPKVQPALYSENAATPANASSLAILVIVNSGKLLVSEYQLASTTLGCYAAAVGHYPLYYIDYKEGGGEATATGDVGPYLKLSNEWYSTMRGKCMEGMDVRKELAAEIYKGKFMFIRHCAVVEFLAAWPDYSWLLVLDGDVGVVNPGRRADEWLDDAADVIFYERDFNWEVMAGGYLVRNTDSARRFLATWAKTHWEYAKKKTRYHLNFDNGALNRLLLQLFASPAEMDKCDEFYWTANQDAEIVLHAICCRYFLERHAFKRASNNAIYCRNDTLGLTVKLLPRGTAWMRDAVKDTVFGKWSPERDFMMHGWKKRFLDFDPTLYGTAWTSPFKTNEFSNWANCSSDAQNSTKEHWREQWKPEWIISGEDRDAIFGKFNENLKTMRDEFVANNCINAV